MDAFLAFLEHVHSLLTTTYHNTPIMLMASPQWTRPDVEAIARYVFERTRTPALCLIHSGIATQYGLKWPHMTVVDVGFQKVDVTCIYDSRVVSHKDVGAADALAVAEGEDISGGEVFTRKLLGLLEDKGFTYEMAEQLKKSNICEVLPYVSDAPKLMELPEEAAAAAEAAPDVPRVADPAAVADDDEEGVNEDKIVTEDGVLDVAKLVVEGQTKEFLAKKEKEKAEKAKAGRKGKDKEEAAKPTRLPNSRRPKNVFHFEEVIQEEVPPQSTEPAAAPAAADPDKKDVAETAEAEKPAAVDGTNGDATTEQTNGSDETKQDPATEAPKPEASAPAPAPVTASQPALPVGPTVRNKRIRKDIEIGLERFLFADREEIDRISTAIYRAVQGIEDMYMRPQCWENLVFVGNGARIRGLKDNIIQTLAARHLISPSTATIFTSELPSNLATPTGTGSQTPTGSYVGGPPHQLGPSSSSVNPLLQAATTASLGIPGGMGGQPGTPGGPTSNAGDVMQAGTHHFHSQTPTHIKLAGLPTYLSEWTKNGFEEAMFLGAQVAARLAFCVHNLDAQGVESQRLMSLNRVDYK